MKLRDRIKFRNRLKRQGKTCFLESMEHAYNGIEYVASHEKNFRIEVSFGFFAVIMGCFLKISLTEWAIIVFTIASVLALEILNTAIEKAVDLVTKDYKELAKASKDAAAGAVLVMSMFSVIIGILIFLPKIIDLIGG